jgi:hypothetical protein
MLIARSISLFRPFDCRDADIYRRFIDSPTQDVEIVVSRETVFGSPQPAVAACDSTHVVSGEKVE